MRPRLLSFVPALSAGLFLTGCASLDATNDIDRSAARVAELAGVAPAWSGPWEPSLLNWDSQTPLAREQAIAIALHNNRDIRAEIESIAQQRADLVQAGLLPNPVLSVALGFPYDPAEGGTLVAASVVQSFTALWLRGGKIRAADARLNQTVLDVSDRAVRLVADVKRAHARIEFGGRALALADEDLASIQRTIDSLDARVRAGEGTPLDVNRGRQQRARIAILREVLLRELAVERRRLLELMGFAGDGADWPVAPSSLVPDDTPPEADAIALALSQRLDVAAAREVTEALRADLSVAERRRLESLAIGAEYERESDGADSIGPALEVEIPIFDIGQARIAQAESQARAALARYEAAVQRGVRDARVAWIELDSTARLAGEFRVTVLATAEQNHRLSQDALASGQADVTVVLESQRELVDARRTLNDLERDATLARISLEEAVGGRLPVATDPFARGTSSALIAPPSVSWVGEMHKTIREGDVAAKVWIGTLLSTPGLNAVGPIEGLAGEITVINGRLHLGTASPEGTRSAVANDAGAPFLVWAHVSEWQSREMPIDVVALESLEERLPALLAAAGLDPATPTVFRVEAVARSLKFHVLRPIPGLPPGREAHDAAQVRGVLADSPVRMIGFFSPDHRGVFTPGSSDLHIHFVTQDGQRSGHVDSFEIQPGALLLLPRPAVR